MTIRYIRHWEFPGNNPDESIIISESQKPHTAVLRARIGSTTISVELAEDRLRAIAGRVGYGPDSIEFQAEPTGASPQEPTDEL